jgi:hypothetical protein
LQLVAAHHAARKWFFKRAMFLRRSCTAFEAIGGGACLRERFPFNITINIDQFIRDTDGVSGFYDD